MLCRISLQVFRSNFWHLDLMFYCLWNCCDHMMVDFEEADFSLLILHTIAGIWVLELSRVKCWELFNDQKILWSSHWSQILVNISPSLRKSNVAPAIGSSSLCFVLQVWLDYINSLGNELDCNWIIAILYACHLSQVFMWIR